MSITASIETLRNWPSEDNYDFASLFKRTYEASERHERHTCVLSEVHEIKDDNMYFTRSISVAQTHNRVLKANCYVD